MLLPVPVVCFTGVLLTDIAYLQSGGNLIWLAFSSWLLLAGLLFGAIAALVLLIDFIRSPGVRRGAGWAHLLPFYAALLIELPSIFIVANDCIVLDKVAKGIVARGDPRKLRDESEIAFVRGFFTRSSSGVSAS